LLLALVLTAPQQLRAQLVIDARTHHLGTPGKPEWQEFAASAPEGRSLELRFAAQANAGERTLLIRQRDVKLAWDIRLNERAVGRLVPMEIPLVHALALPAASLREGENLLVIGPPPGDDDVVIEGVTLDPRPLRQALGGATLEVNVTEHGRSTALPCRITILDERGALAPLTVPPDAHLAARPGAVYTPNGHARIGLPTGRYMVYASRGFEYGIDSTRINLAEGQHRRADLAIRREVPTEGLVACDTHVHTLTHSGHGDATIDERAVTLAGEGIELPIATDHDHLTTDLAAAADRMVVSAYFTPVVGDEVTTRAGHFNAFPFPPDAPVPDPKLETWPDLLRAIRSAPGERVVVLNHARDLHAGFRPFDPRHFNPVTGEHRRGPLGTDAVEVINSGAMQSDPLQLARDWMALRNHGQRLTAIGASDSHDVARYIVGQGRTYVFVADTNPARIDIQAACRALKSGRALVSLGLLARMTVDGQFQVGDLATNLGNSIAVSVAVHGPSWTTADHVALYANGVKIRESPLDPTPSPLKASIEWTIPRLSHDVALVAVASGPGVTSPHWAIARPYQPTSPEWTPCVMAITNSIDVDGDGDGVWTSPRAYAQALINRVGLEPQSLLPALAPYDEAVAAQAARLCHAAGHDVGGSEYRRRLASAPEPVQRGFHAYAASLAASQNDAAP
jgi:hypothetical protein